MTLDPNDPLVEVHRSARKAALFVLGIPEEELTGEQVNKLITAGRIQHMFERNLPKKHKYRDGTWNSVWLTVSDTLPRGWYMFPEGDPDKMRGPMRKKRQVLRVLRVDTSTYEDTGLYSVGDTLIANAEVATEILEGKVP